MMATGTNTYIYEAMLCPWEVSYVYVYAYGCVYVYVHVHVHVHVHEYVYMIMLIRSEVMCLLLM